MTGNKLKRPSEEDESQKERGLPKGPVIPAGTEQETGLSRGITEAPETHEEEEDSGRQMNKTDEM